MVLAGYFWSRCFVFHSKLKTEFSFNSSLTIYLYSICMLFVLNLIPSGKISTRVPMVL